MLKSHGKKHPKLKINVYIHHICKLEDLIMLLRCQCSQIYRLNKIPIENLAGFDRNWQADSKMFMEILRN